MTLEEMELQLHNQIKELHSDIKSMTPDDGFSSPRDYKLVTLVNKKGAILRHLQDAMKVINKDYYYKG